MHVDQTHIKRTIDWITIGSTLAISLIGLLFKYSACPHMSYLVTQTMGIILGFIIYTFFALTDFRMLCRWGYFLYFLTIGLLCFTLVKGHIGMGGQRWIDVKFFTFQPSELAKLFLPAFVVYYLHGEAEHHPIRRFTVILIILALSALLILKQPDLGTAIIVTVSGFVMLWYAGLSRRFIFWASIFGLLSMPIIYKCLKPYQRKRIEVFLGAGDMQKERYQVEQAKIAIGSGGFEGKGILQGTQNRFAFLPERRTDFIFAILCEEWGFIGASFLLFLYIILIAHVLWSIWLIKNPLNQLLALGLVTPVAVSIIVNIGMVTGLLPVVGVPLPLMSHGFSHSWVTYAALGWINSITSHKAQKTWR